MYKPWAVFPSALVAVGVLSLSLSFPAAAALINVDWQMPSDGLLVKDTTTQLEWLKLTETMGMSYADVSSQLGTGGTFEGLRYATNAEVIDLFAGYFGISLGASIYYGQRPGIDSGVRLASETLGTGERLVTYSPGDDPNANYILIGYTGEQMMDGTQFILGAHTRYSDTDYFTAQDPVSPYEYYAGDAYYDPVRGSYLVRTALVPLPAAAWLFGSGMLGLIAVARRKAG